MIRPLFGNVNCSRSRRLRCGKKAKETQRQSASSSWKRRALEKNHAQIPALLMELVLVYDLFQASADADRALAELVKLKPQEADTYLVKARLAAQRNKDDEALATLAEGIQKTSGVEKSRLQRELIKFELAVNRDAEASQQLRALLQNRAPSETNTCDGEMLNLVLAFAEQALSKQDSAAVKNWESTLLKLEGPEGSLWRYVRLRRLLNAAKNVNDPQFAEADRLQNELRKIRPSWAPGYLLDGHRFAATRQVGGSRGCLSKRHPIRLSSTRGL